MVYTYIYNFDDWIFLTAFSLICTCTSLKLFSPVIMFLRLSFHCTRLCKLGRNYFYFCFPARQGPILTRFYDKKKRFLFLKKKQVGEHYPLQTCFIFKENIFFSKRKSPHFYAEKHVFFIEFAYGV